MVQNPGYINVDRGFFSSLCRCGDSRAAHPVTSPSTFTSWTSARSGAAPSPGTAGCYRHRDDLPIRDGFGYPDIIEDIIDMPATGPDPGGIDMTIDTDMTVALDITGTEAGDKRLKLHRGE